MPELIANPLDESTWSDFARLVEKHNGVWGGCWCMSFHEEGVGRCKGAAQNRSEKERRVREGRAHAAPVYDGADAVGWCQFGPAEELPRIKLKWDPAWADAVVPNPQPGSIGPPGRIGSPKCRGPSVSGRP